MNKSLMKIVFALLLLSILLAVNIVVCLSNTVKRYFFEYASWSEPLGLGKLDNGNIVIVFTLEPKEEEAVLSYIGLMEIDKNGDIVKFKVYSTSVITGVPVSAVILPEGHTYVLLNSGTLLVFDRNLEFYAAVNLNLIYAFKVVFSNNFLYILGDKLIKIDFKSLNATWITDLRDLTLYEIYPRNGIVYAAGTYKGDLVIAGFNDSTGKLSFYKVYTCPGRIDYPRAINPELTMALMVNSEEIFLAFIAPRATTQQPFYDVVFAKFNSKGDPEQVKAYYLDNATFYISLGFPLNNYFLISGETDAIRVETSKGMIGVPSLYVMFINLNNEIEKVKIIHGEISKRIPDQLGSIETFLQNNKIIISAQEIERPLKNYIVLSEFELSELKEITGQISSGIYVEEVKLESKEYELNFKNTTLSVKTMNLNVNVFKPIIIQSTFEKPILIENKEEHESNVNYIWYVALLGIIAIILGVAYAYRGKRKDKSKLVRKKFKSKKIRHKR